MLHNIHLKFYGQTWAISPAVHRIYGMHLQDAIQKKQSGEPLERRFSRTDDPDRGITTPYRGRKDIGVMHVTGPIGKHLSTFEMDCGGGFDLTAMNAALDTVVQRGISTLVMEFDTPGGTVTGVPETASRIEELGKKGVKTIAYTESMMCSAGMWLASGCEEIYAAPSAIVGSIGVYCALLDSSRQMEMKGLGVEYFVGMDAPLKTAGAPGIPISEAAREEAQAGVDMWAEAFYEQISRRRPDMKDEKWKSGAAWEAMMAPIGLIDGFAPTMQDLLLALI